MALLNLLLLLLQICVAVKSEVQLQKRIIGGGPCTNNERRYHVALYFNDDPDPVCGGSLISDRWVLTAAHCWTNAGVHIAVVGVHPGLGTPMKITDNPVVYIDQNGLQHDIMLLKLPQPITTIRPVVLPDCNRPLKVGDEVQIAGFGATTANADGTKRSDTSTKRLQCAKFNVKEIDLSRPSWFSGDMFSLETNGVHKVDTCPGDSGGGAVFNNMIYGVHVMGGKKVCEIPAYEMDVCKYKKWIMTIINSPFSFNG